MADSFVLLLGGVNRLFGEAVATVLDMSADNARVGRFPDGEVDVGLNVSVRSRHVVIVGSICPPDVNGAFMEILLLANAAFEAGAVSTSVVSPYLGYARSDAPKEGDRLPLAIRVVGHALADGRVNNVSQVMVGEPHFRQVKLAFSVPTTPLNLRAPTVAELLKVPELAEAKARNTLMALSPDLGGIHRARAYARALGCRWGIVDKERHGPADSTAGEVIGDVANMDCLVVDDLTASVNTLNGAAEKALDRGAKSVRAVVMHPVLPDEQSVKNLTDGPLVTLHVGDTIPRRPYEDGVAKLQRLSYATFFARAITRFVNGGSITELCKTWRG